MILRGVATAAAIFGAAILIGGWAIYAGHQAVEDCISYQGLTSHRGTPRTTSTDWSWRKLELVCVFSDHDTGRVVRVDIDDARREIARH